MTVHLRNIAHVRGDDALHAFADVAQRTADLVRRRKLDKQAAVDRLYDAAIAYGLVDIYGDDEIQAIFSKAFLMTTKTLKRPAMRPWSVGGKPSASVQRMAECQLLHNANHSLRRFSWI